MKPIRKYSKLVALFLSLLIVNCSIYKSTNVSLDEAVTSESPVKITKVNGEMKKYRKIVVTDKNEFYGKKKNRTKDEDIDKHVLIEPNTVQNIRVKDKTASTIISITIPLVFIIGLALFGASGGYSVVGGPISIPM